MNKFKFYFTLFSTLLVLFSCNKDDDDSQDLTPLRDYQTQYNTDIENIEKYLDTYFLNPDISDYASNVNNPDLIKKRTGNEPSIKSLLTSTTFPKLSLKLVNKHNITYTVYYLQFSEGNATEKPCPFDEVLATYRGTSLAKVSDVVSATEFEDTPTATKFVLTSTSSTVSGTISGWQEIFPLFGKGTFDEVATGNGPNVYNNYGAGVMFVPSGLAYFNQSSTNIPSYSPLVFSFKLLNFRQIDNDGDGIMTADEIIRNTDGSFTYTNTDGADVADYFDIDDDNDGYTTLNERKYTLSLQEDPTQQVYYYPINGAILNDPTTLIDETKGIPSCGNSPDYFSPTRIRKHLDKNCH